MRNSRVIAIMAGLAMLRSTSMPKYKSLTVSKPHQKKTSPNSKLKMTKSKPNTKYKSSKPIASKGVTTFRNKSNI